MAQGSFSTQLQQQSQQEQSRQTRTQRKSISDKQKFEKASAELERQRIAEEQRKYEAEQKRLEEEDKSAFEEAKKHVKKGYGQAYLYFMEHENSRQVQLVRYYIAKLLADEQASREKRDTGFYHYYQADTQEAREKNLLIGSYTIKAGGGGEKKFYENVKAGVYNPQSAENIYQAYQQQRQTKPAYLDVTTADITLPYEQRGTINAQASKTKFYPILAESNKIETSEEKSLFEKAKGYYKTFTEKTGDIQIPIFIGAGGSVNIKDIKKPISEKLGEQSQKVYEKMTSEIPNKQAIENQFQEEYQNRFESAYMKKIIYGETTFETAKSEFEKSETAKIISQKYGTAITEDTKNLRLLKKWEYGTELAGLGLGKVVVDFVPTNYGDLVVKTAVVGAGIGAIQTIPASVNLAITGGMFGYGTYKAFSPKSTPIEAGSGLITSIISGASLGYAGYRYLGKPIIKTETIKPPKTSLHTTSTIGKDVKIITDEETLNKVLYPRQKLSQIAVAGRRTIVTTKWRDLLNKYAGFDIKNIYEGIPTEQRAVYGTDIFRGGRYLIKESGYQKALKKLVNYGYTDYQAKATLRYYAPKVTEQWLEKGMINIGEMKATGKFIFETKKPVLKVDEVLGIKTKGGRTIQDVYNVERRLIEKNNEPFIFESRQKISSFLNKKGAVVKLKDVEFSRAITKVKVSDLQKGSEYLGTNQGVSFWKEPSEYQDLYSISGEFLSMKITPKVTPTTRKAIVDIITNKRKYDIGRTTLFQDEWDLRTNKGFTRITGEKTRQASQTSVEQVINKISNQRIDTGFSEKLNLGMSEKTISQLETQLKTSVMPRSVSSSANLKELSNVKMDIFSGLDVGLAGASITQLKEQLKQQAQLKASLKEMTQFDQRADQTLRADQRLNQSLRNATGLRLITPQLPFEIITPEFKTPPVPPTKPKITPVVALFGNDNLLKERLRTKLEKSLKIEALLPDFTARAIGIAPRKAKTVKEALKEIEKLQTGFEIRSGISISEKKLMKGIME